MRVRFIPEFFKVVFATTSRVQCSSSRSSLSPPPLLVLSLLIHLSPRANVYHLLPTLMGRMPSRSTPRRLPSSHLSHPHPLTPSSSSLVSITISLGSLPQEQVSISLPLPPALPVPSSYLRGGFFFFSPPPLWNVCTTPSPQAFVHVHVHACAAAQAN